MKTNTRYWTCQVAGWGSYSATGAFSAAHQVGWRLSVVAGYLLFFLYSIAMTDLFRREIRRRQWLAGSWWTYDRVFGAHFKGVETAFQAALGATLGQAMGRRRGSITSALPAAPL